MGYGVYHVEGFETDTLSITQSPSQIIFIATAVASSSSVESFQFRPYIQFLIRHLMLCTWRRRTRQHFQDQAQSYCDATPTLPLTTLRASG